MIGSRPAIPALCMVCIASGLSYGQGSGPKEPVNCISQDAPIQGELRLTETRHPNGARIVVFQLVLFPKVCVLVSSLERGKFERLENIGSIHLAAEPGVLKKLRLKLGKLVTAQGELSEPMTAWHIGDAVMFKARIVKIEE